MRFWHVLRSRLRSLLFRPRREADLREELQLHLERETERLEATGMPADAARVQALRTFGGLEPTTEACRDARGTALFDAVAQDVRYAVRSFRRTPLTALTIVMTVGLGLGLVAVVFTILNAYIFRVDEVLKPDELFAVERQGSASADPPGFTYAQYEELVRETGAFSDAFATTPEIDGWLEGRRMEGPLVTGNFFQVLGVSAARGSTLTPSDDQPGGHNVIVLSHLAWTRHFGSDPGVLSRTVLLNGTPFQVVGVMPEGFRGLAIVAAPDYWAPLSTLGGLRRGQQARELPVGLHVIGRLKPGVSRGQALAQLAVWDTTRAAERSGERPAARLVLEPRQGTAPQPAEVMLAFVPLFFAFGLILMIGCANVANLLLARAVARQREIGIRLAIGASRRRVISQLLTESLLLALVSAAMGFFVSRLALAGVVYAAISTFPPEFGDIRLALPPADWRVALFLVSVAMVATLLFALAPALQATRVQLVRAMRGEVVPDSRPGRVRGTLVGLQVTSSVVLLISAAIFLRSSWAAANVDPGIRTTDTVNVNVLNEQRRRAILEVVASEPSMVSMGAAWPGLGGRPAMADGASGTSTVRYQFVSPEYFGAIGVDLVRGRGFTQDERSTDAAVAIVSERVARDLWPGLEAVGQMLRLEPGPSSEIQPNDPPPPSQTLIVVGVVRDVAGFRLGGLRMGGAGVYVPTAAEAAGTSLMIRVRGDSERARHALVDRFAAVDPNMAEVSTLKALARMEAYLLGIPFWLTLVLGALALLLTLSGLVSVLSYLVERRTREIGVRMALGATRGRVVALVLTQLARPVGIGVVLGGSLTAALGALLLTTSAAEQIGTSVRLFDPVAYAGSLLCIVTACVGAALVPALRAGRIDPVGALRRD